jgi:hypothetical protein
MGKSKLTNRDREEITRRHQQGETLTALAKEFHVTRTALGQMLARRGLTVEPVIPHIPDLLTLAYYAGVFDGEGHITICASRRTNGTAQYWLQIGVGNTYLPLLESLKTDFGVGHLSKLYGPKNVRPRVPAMCWRCTSNQAMYVLEAMLPFLRIKQEPAKVAIEFQKQSFSSRDLEWKQSMKEKIAALNRLS